MALAAKFIARTKQWWAAKTGFLISLLCVYLATCNAPFAYGIELLGLAMIAIFGLGSLGHVLNDWTDIAEDKAAGKSNTMSGIPSVLRLVILLITVVVGFSPWFLGFESNQVVWVLVFGEVLLFLLYSLKPFRLKRVPHIAVCLDALYAYVNPSLFLWLSFDATLENDTCYLMVAVIICWTFPYGIRQILNHHVSDANNDLKSGAPNLANIYGKQAILKLIRLVAAPLEVVSLIGFIILAAGLNLPFGIVLLLSAVVVILLSFNRKTVFINVRFGELPLDTFYTSSIGFVSILYLASVDLFYLLLVLLHLALFTNIDKHPIVKLTVRNAPKWLIVILKWPFQMISLLGNWALYYFRKWILQWSEERNWGEHYTKRLEEERLNKKGNIAVFNQNYQKFSETFINGQLVALDYRTYYYYGWPKPIFEQKAGNLLGSSEYAVNFKQFFFHVLNLNWENYQHNRISDSLIGNNIKLMVAHFGTMGVQLLEVAKKTGIPMVVVFHGYDAWNKSQLAEVEDTYPELFEIASCVVGVSKDICEQLKRLGCDPNKVEYLPDYVNPKFMNPSSVENTNPEFLSVGRFSGTKSPHILLNAFALVVKKFPDANLTMIGTDDGEGLFEACHMLVRSLGIEENVDFKGACDSNQVHEEMSKNPIFVQHSVTTSIDGDKEGTPVAVMEAMAMGLPIVATNHAGIGEMIDHNRTGLLVSEYDFEKMAEEMVRVASDSEFRKALGQNAASEIQSNELVSRSLQKFSSIIDKHKIAP